MKLKNNNAEFFIPDNINVEEALDRTSYMAIAAHQDDIEIMAQDGILKCFGNAEDWFFAVVVTNGAGSPRNGLYENYSDEQMQKIRKLEQKKAAYVGEYGGLALLNYESAEVKRKVNDSFVQELTELMTRARPKVIYTHNLADKHDTHVAVAIKVIQALRLLPKEMRPERVVGCEVWRNLDWVCDNEKVVFDVSAHSNLADALVSVYDSQISGGKRYDLATVGRRLANATYSTSHGVDIANSVIFGMDLTELINNPTLEIGEFVKGYIQRFGKDVEDRLEKFM